MKKFFYFTSLMLLVSVLLVSCNSDDSIEQAADQSAQQFEAAGIQNMENDALFIAEAASNAMLQLRLSESATDKAVSPEVRELAHRMQKEHLQVLTELQNMADQTMFILPQELGKAHQKTFNEVHEMSGLGYDITYVKNMNSLHKNILDRYEDMAEHGVNMEVKMFASKQLPLIRQHIEMTEKISDQIESSM
jgi:putative membrane protein